MNRIKEWRTKLNVTQAQFAKLCGWPNGQARISNYEQGIRIPSLKESRSIVSALNELGADCDLQDIFPID